MPMCKGWRGALSSRHHYLTGCALDRGLLEIRLYFPGEIATSLAPHDLTGRPVRRAETREPVSSRELGTSRIQLRKIAGVIRAGAIPVSCEVYLGGDPTHLTPLSGGGGLRQSA
jgi:hypothetical protein